MRLVGGSDLLRDGLHIGRWIASLAVDFDVDHDGADGFILRGLADDPFDIGIDAPAIVSGSHVVDPATLHVGPLMLTPPRAAGTATPGQTLAAESGIILRDPVYGRPVSVYTWYRGGVLVAEAPDYAVQPNDDLFGIVLRQTLTSAVGQVSREATIIADAVYPEQAVAFAGSDILLSPDPVAQTEAEARSLVLFASFDTAADAGGVERIVDLGGMRIQRTATGTLNLRVADDAGSDIVVSCDIATGERIHALCRATWDPVGGMTATLAWKAAGADWAVLSGTAGPGAATQVAAQAPVGIGGRNSGATSQAFRGTIYRAAVWAGAAAVDVADPAVQSVFVDAGGGLRPPALAETLLGQAPIDWHGAKADAILGKHDGSQGDLTVVGSPTLVETVPSLPSGQAFATAADGAYLVDGGGDYLTVGTA